METIKNQSQDDKPSNTWDKLKEVPFSGNSTDSQSNIGSSNPNQDSSNHEISRQQRKLIGIITNDDLNIISQPDYNATEQEYQTVLSMIQNGKVSDDQLKNIVSNIAGPLDIQQSETVLSRFNNDKHLYRILSTMSGHGFDNYRSVTATSLENFIDKYPNPADFENDSSSFLSSIKKYNPEEKYQEYKTAMHNFVHAVYGKKQEYWDEIKALKRAALKDQPPKDEETTFTPESFTQSVAIDGDEFTYNGKNYQLTPDFLQRQNLEPRHEFSLGDIKIGLSDQFKIGQRDCCIAYIPTPEGSLKTRSYYRSNSSALWRYLPDYAADEDGNIIYYGKAYGEESVTLPYELQRKLNEINLDTPPRAGNINSDFCFFGTAKKYPSKKEYARLRDTGQLRGDYYEEVNRRPLYNFGRLDFRKKPPETIDITDGNAPDFNHQQDQSFDIYTPLYDHVKVKSFLSNDKNLKYIMCETANSNRATWIGNIEVNSKITSTGLHSEWVSMGDVGTPLYEYKSQADGYGDPHDSKGSYQNMWKNYLSKMPIIQRYINETK